MKLPKEVEEILNKFIQSGFKVYIVGGAVRDFLMEKGGLPAGRQVSDWDFTTDATPEDILKLFPEGFYDNKFGTVGISARHLPGEQKRHLEDGDFEVTTMRKEGIYKDHRHPVQVSWTDKIEEDLARRDFTVNAMALGLASSVKGEGESKNKSYFTLNALPFTLIDPFNGQADLVNNLIRAVGEPDKRFQEDALRLIRAIRFASQFNFDIEKNTFEAIKKNADLIKEIAFERIRDELFKILASANPYIGMIKLREAGILQIILPELEACFGIVQEGPKHDRIYDIGDHCFRTMRETPSLDPVIKFAALLHDVGKAQTFAKDAAGNVTFYNHDIVGAETVRQIARRFNISKKQTDVLYRLVRWHMFSTDERQTDSAIRRFIRNVGLENLEDMYALRIGDRLGGDTRKPVSWRMEEFQKRVKKVLEKPFSLSDLKVNGNDVMKTLNIPPGRKVGEILETIFQEVLEDSSKNRRDYLLKRIKELQASS